MTITNTSVRVVAEGNGVTTSFNYTFLIADTSSIRLTAIDSSGVETTVATSAVTISGIGNTAGGTVIYAPAIGTGSKFVIWRRSPYTQETSFSNQDGYYPATTEDALDWLAYQTQQLQDEVSRAIKVSIGSTLGMSTLAVESVRAGYVVGFDTSGQVTLVEPGSGSAVSAFWAAELLTTNAATALTGLGGSTTGINIFTASTQTAAQSALGVRRKLTADTTFAVPGDFATLQAAAEHIWGALDLGTFNVQVNSTAATDTGGISMNRPYVGSGYVSFVGNTTTPSNTVISTTSRDCVYMGGGACVRIAGFKLTAATSGFGLHAGGIGGDGTATSMGGIAGGIAVIGNMDYSTVAASYAHVYADFNGIVQMGNASYTISGGGGAHLWCEDGGLINEYHGGTPTASLSVTAAFSTAFAIAGQGSVIRTSLTKVYSGSATGTRWIADGGEIRFFTNSADSYFPGNAAGLFRAGGMIDTSQTHSGTALTFSGLRQNKDYTLRITKLLNATNDDDSLQMDVSTNAGVAYVAANYNGIVRAIDDEGGVTDTTQSAATIFTVLHRVPRGNGGTFGDLDMNFSGMDETASAAVFCARGAAGRTSGEVYDNVFSGTLTTPNIDTIRFRLSDTAASFSCRYRLEERG